MLIKINLLFYKGLQCIISGNEKNRLNSARPVSGGGGGGGGRHNRDDKDRYRQNN